MESLKNLDLKKIAELYKLWGNIEKLMQMGKSKDTKAPEKQVEEEERVRDIYTDKEVKQLKDPFYGFRYAGSPMSFERPTEIVKFDGSVYTQEALYKTAVKNYQRSLNKYNIKP
jgi:hypothetical protein